MVENLPAKNIADLLGCSPTTVKAYLQQFSLTKGGRGSAVHKAKLAYGRRIAETQQVPHKGEVQTINSIKKMFLEEGLRPRAIARILDSMKVQTKRRGKKWDHSVIIAILKREGLYKQSRKSPRQGETK